MEGGSFDRSEGSCKLSMLSCNVWSRLQSSSVAESRLRDLAFYPDMQDVVNLREPLGQRVSVDARRFGGYAYPTRRANAVTLDLANSTRLTCILAS